LIRRKARQIAVQARLRREDRDDLEQELWAHLIRRWSSFDPTRGHCYAFVTTIIERYTANVLRDLNSRRRLSGGTSSLHRLVDSGDDGPEELAATLEQGSANRRRGLHQRSNQELIALAMDVATVLARLPVNLRDLAERLMRDSVAKVARDMTKARTSLYTPVGHLRQHLEDAGLRAYLEKPSSRRARAG
jgi:hypothetical protein